MISLVDRIRLAIDYKSVKIDLRSARGTHFAVYDYELMRQCFYRWRNRL